jgi:hypothetical protein
MDEEVLFNKNGVKLIKIQKNNYNLQFIMENNNIVLSKIIDFNLIKLIYDLNKDIYEKVNIEKINENEAIVNFLMKNFFEDLGLAQKFSFFNIKKSEEVNKIIFNSKTITSYRPLDMPDDAEILNMDNFNVICEIINSHKILFNFTIIFNENVNVPNFAEKIIGQIINKIFNRLKQFIENIRM